MLKKYEINKVDIISVCFEIPSLWFLFYIERGVLTVSVLDEGYVYLTQYYFNTTIY